MAHDAPGARPRHRLLSVLGAALLAGVLAAGGLTWQATVAAFTDQTGTAGNTVSAGTVSISNERSGQQILPAVALAPDDELVTCVKVSYTGTVEAKVRIYAQAYDDTSGLGAFLTVSVEEGDAGNYAGCNLFNPTQSLLSGEPLATFAARTGFATGVGVWQPTGPAFVTYRITIAFPSTVNDNNAQGKSVDVTFGWAAESV